MSPRAAGVLAIAGSLGLAVLGGWLLASPPWSIPGAAVLVAATILLSVGTVWLYRRSWSDPWPPDVTPSMQKRMRRIRVLQVVNSLLFVGMVAAAISAIVRQDWVQLSYAGIFLVVGLGNLSMNRRTMRYLRELERLS